MIEDNIITLKEDRSYDLDYILYKVESLFDVSVQKEKFVEDFSFWAIRLGAACSGILASVYRELNVEAPTPRYSHSRNVFEPGQWIGWFRYRSKLLPDDVFFFVEPKIERRAFEHMLNEITVFFSILGLPAMSVASRNIYGDSSMSKTVTYSNLLQQYTELALKEGQPRISFQEEVLSPVPLGPIDFQRTKRNIERQIDLIVSRPTRVSYATLPRLITAKFHASLLLNLQKIVSQIDAGMRTVLRVPFKNLQQYHKFILSDEEYFGILDEAFSHDLESSEVIEEAKIQCGKNEWLHRIVEAYEFFINDLRWGEFILGKYEDLLPLQPLPTSKIYELWVLKLITESLSKLTSVKLTRKQLAEISYSGLAVHFDSVKLTYNTSYRPWSKLLKSIGKYPRPDYVISPNGGKAAVDAKYKEYSNLNLGDLERILAYLLDYSEPQHSEEIKAFFIVLKQDKDFIEIGERIDLFPPVRLFSAEANPENRARARDSVQKICSRIVAQ